VSPWANRLADQAVYLGRATIVSMVQAADLWNGDDRADRWRRDRPWVWRVLGEREMGPRVVVVRQWAVSHAEGRVTQSIRSAFAAAICEFATHRIRS
jgi:hypothetical protein